MCVGIKKKKSILFFFFLPYGFDLFIYFKYSFKDYLRASGVWGNLIPVASEFAGSLMVDCFPVWLIILWAHLTWALAEEILHSFLELFPGRSFPF